MYRYLLKIWRERCHCGDRLLPFAVAVVPRIYVGACRVHGPVYTFSEPA